MPNKKTISVRFRDDASGAVLFEYSPPSQERLTTKDRTKRVAKELRNLEICDSKKAAKILAKGLVKYHA